LGIDPHSSFGSTAAQQSSSTSTRARCSPRWIIYHNQRAFGARWNTGATTQQRCLRGCEIDPSCMAAEWNSSCCTNCWLHYSDGYRDRSPVYGVTQFEIVRGCETSGMVMPTKLPNSMYNKRTLSMSTPYTTLIHTLFQLTLTILTIVRG